MTKGQKKRLTITIIAAVMLLASIVPVFTTITARMAAVDIGIGQETYQYVAHDHDWDAELAAAEAEVAEKNDFAELYISLGHWDRVILAIASWAIFISSLVMLYFAFDYECRYQNYRRKQIKLRPVAY